LIRQKATVNIRSGLIEIKGDAGHQLEPGLFFLRQKEARDVGYIPGFEGGVRRTGLLPNRLQAHADVLGALTIHINQALCRTRMAIMDARHNNLCLARWQAMQHKASGTGGMESQDLLYTFGSHPRSDTMQRGWGRDLRGNLHIDLDIVDVSIVHLVPVLVNHLDLNLIGKVLDLQCGRNQRGYI
jgi:hypothetical protein